MVFADQNPAPAHLGHGGPQIAREAVGVARIAQLAQGGDGRLFFQELLCAVAQHGLFFVQNERHGG